MSSFIGKEVQCVILLIILSIKYFNVVCGEQCLNNSTITKCNVNQVLTTVKNCTKCICRSGYYHHTALGGCAPCDKCNYPKVVVKECSQTSNTECGVCKENYYRTKDGCKKCQKCKHGVVKPCGKDNDTFCVKKVTMAIPTTGTEKSTISLNVTSSSHEHHHGSEKDWRTNPIWAILFIISLTIIVVLILTLFMTCRNSRPTFYVPTDTTSLATSLSSIFLTKPKFPDLTCLTEQERGTLIAQLPGGYAELLAQLLNPNSTNNWVHLAYEFKLTMIQVANLKNSSEPTQDLLLFLCSINTTVELLFNALKNIKRDDAGVRLVNFILDLRKDDESCLSIDSKVNMPIYVFLNHHEMEDSQV